VGRVAVLVDHPPAPPKITKADAERLGLRAYARLYTAESILAVEYRSHGGIRKLVNVRLKEIEIVRDAEQNETEVNRVRELRLDGGVYVQIVHTKDGEKWVAGPAVRPVRN